MLTWNLCMYMVKYFWQRSAGDLHLPQGMGTLLGRQSKQDQDHCLYQQSECGEFHEHKATEPTTGLVGGDSMLL